MVTGGGGPATPENRRTGAPRIVVVGPPGAGKSTAGTRLAARLGVAFADTDVDAEAVLGCSIADAFVDQGEAAFRAVEERCVAQALATFSGVLALGGGAVLSAATRARLAAEVVVYLEVSLATAARRVGLARDRPVLALNPRAQLRALLDERRPLYTEVATVTVDADTDGPDLVAERILRALEQQGLSLRTAVSPDARQ